MNPFGFFLRWLDRRMDRRIVLAAVRSSERQRLAARGSYREWMDKYGAHSPDVVAEAFRGYEEEAAR